jgi:hypothetical protein
MAGGISRFPRTISRDGWESLATPSEDLAKWSAVSRDLLRGFREMDPEGWAIAAGSHGIAARGRHRTRDESDPPSERDGSGGEEGGVREDRVTLRSAMTPDPALDAEVRSLVDDYRERCLWFVRADYYPSTPDEILRVLRWIRARGDRKAFQRAGKIEEWLSRTSSETSAAS